MFCDSCAFSTGIILLFLVMITRSFSKSVQSNIENSTLGSDEYVNRTKSRILTRPNNVEFYGREQDIVFPDKIDRVDVSSRISATPQCPSTSLSYCENVEGYPYEQIKRVLEQTRLYHSFFGKDEAPSLAITNRLGVDDDEEFVCRSRRKVIFPQMMQTKNNEWKFVINQGKNEPSIQGILIEECSNPGTNCEIPGGSILDKKFTMTCKQKHIYRRLLSIDSEGNFETKSFKIPSTCSCGYKQKQE